MDGDWIYMLLSSSASTSPLGVPPSLPSGPLTSPASGREIETFAKAIICSVSCSSLSSS